MYSLDTTQKFKIAALLLALLFIALAVLPLFLGGSGLLKNVSVDGEYLTILMVGSLCMAFVFFFLFLALRAIQKDIKEHLKYLNDALRK